MKKYLIAMIAFAAAHVGAQAPTPVWELGKDPIDPAGTTGDVRIEDGIVKLDCSNAFAIPAAVLGDQTDYTIEMEFRRGSAFQNLPRTEGALRLLSNRDPEAKAGLSLIYFPPEWDRNGGVGNALGIEVNTYWNGETGGLEGDGFNTYSLVVKDRQASLYRNGMLLAMTGVINPSSQPLTIGGAGWRGTARYGVTKAIPEPYELRALRVYNVALVPTGFDPSANVMRNVSGENYNMQCAVITNAALPRILVVGDSISMGYRRFITEHFKGRAYVDYWVGGSWFDGTVKGDDFPALRAWDGVLANGPYDVVSWNAMTLHMWNGTPGRVNETNYPGQMTRVVEHLLKTAPDTRFIWIRCTPWRTTPDSGRPTPDPTRNDLIVRLNAVTDRIMADHGIPAIDLYALCMERFDTVSDGSKDAVHWNQDVSREMADRIIGEIEKKLSGKPIGQAACFAPDARVLNGPSFYPPFEIKQGERVDAEFRVATFLDPEANNQPAESATLVFGNKRVSVREGKDKKMETGRDNVVSIFVNEVPVFDVIMVGGYQSKDGPGVAMIGGKRLEGVEFSADPETGVIRWSRRYPLPDGTQAEMAYELKSPGESRVEVSWDIGLTDEQIKKFNEEGNRIGGMLVYFDVKGDYRKDGLTIDGANIRPKSVDELKAKEKQLQIIWEGTLHELSSAPDKPLHGFTVHSERGLKGSLREVFKYGRIDLGFMFPGRGRDSLVIDLGLVASPDMSAPPAIESHDLWVQDALHLPKSPTKNLFPNPSFEQGLFYWRWWSGGAKYEPSDVMRYEVDRENGRFGKQAMVINPVQRNSAPLRSFSMPSAKGQTYTLSFYAKAETAGAGVRLAPYSSKTGGKFTRQTVGQTPAEVLGQDWQRFSYSFVSDGTPISFILLADGRGGKIWLDGMQLEAGAEATAFAAPPLEGELTTSHHQNNVEFGDKIGATYAVRGEAGTQGKVSLELRDFFKETVWSRQYDTRAEEVLDLPFDDLKLGTGVYLLKSTFEVPGSEPYVAYYRFTVIDSLDGTHATKDLYGALIAARISRTEEALALVRRLGFAGSSSYGSGKISDPIGYALREKFSITDYTHEVVECPHLTAEQKRDRHPDYLLSMSINPRTWRTAEERKVIPEWDTYSDEVLAQFEDLCERVARECPYVRVWSIATEEEVVFPALIERNFKEFAKLQEVFYRGIKRGNPNAMVLPAGGTSGYGKTRGKEDIDGFLSATHGKIKWDAVAIHPYGAIDGTLGATDLDEAVQMLSESMAKYGYGEETPMLLNEGGGGSSSMWGDGPFWSYDGGQPSYDQGMMEFLHACKMARQYIICLKYWPRLPHFNTWQSDGRWIVDHNLTPSSFLLGINTLGHILGDPKFIADVRPAAGVRGYAFEDKTHGGVAAVWCTIDDVERGFVKGPVMRVRFGGDLPELVDLMGRRHVLKAGADGSVDIQLTPAPLFLKGKDPLALTKALQDAQVLGASSNVAVSFLPTMQGGIDVNVKNLTSREQTGDLEIEGKAVPFQVAASQEQRIQADEGKKSAFGKMFAWNKDYLLKQPETEPASKQWQMDYFYVPKVNETPDWSQVPAIPMPNLYRPVVNLKQTPGGHAGDISATFQAAWDGDNFYLRVEGEDDILDFSEPRFWSSEQAQVKALYMLDGCLEVYFDCAANGRLGNKGFDLDDYRYDFSPGNPEGTSGSGKVYRFYEVFNEYAGGVEFPTKEEAAKGVKCEFTRLSPTRYAYTITFPQRYIAPLRLEAGYTAGFALYLHDRMDDGEFGDKGLSLATEPGAHADRSPHLWPLMILSE